MCGKDIEDWKNKIQYYLQNREEADVSAAKFKSFLERECSEEKYASQKFVRCLLCAAILLLGGKRVAWLGIAWSLFVYFLFFKIKERKDRIIKITMISYFVVAWDTHNKAMET